LLIAMSITGVAVGFGLIAISRFVGLDAEPARVGPPPALPARSDRG
jgi:hypothetical protein